MNRVISSSAVLLDISRVRAELRSTGGDYLHLLALRPLRPVVDIALDWAVVLLAIAFVTWSPVWATLPAVVIVGNRQRALGNLLHDAGHRNICRDRWINDAIARVLIAPLVFASLSTYRAAHFKHHMELGAQGKDPDLMPPPLQKPLLWYRSYASFAFNLKAWQGSLLGHFGDSHANVRSKLLIVAWWATLGAALWHVAGGHFLAAFILVWFAARASVFHMITTFREMCDHFGLSPGGVLSFTRDIAGHGIWRCFIHPRNNGYHLTHHLLPAVPYYRLPEAYRLISQAPAYPKDQVRQSYVLGPRPVTHDWQQKDVS